MAANSITAQQLQNAADLAWHARWNIAWDMNGDGMVTISDALLWLKWTFFAPGDLLLLLLMSYGTPIALFLEINPSWLSGVLSDHYFYDRLAHRVFLRWVAARLRQ